MANGNSGNWRTSQHSGPPWLVILFAMLGGVGLYLIFEFQGFLAKHLHSYNKYNGIVLLIFLLGFPAGIFFFYRTGAEMWQNWLELWRSLRWYHWMWAIIFISGLVFRKRTASEGMEAPVDSAALFRIGLVGFVGSVLLVKLFMRKLDWLSSVFRGIVGLLIWFDLMALLSTVWSVYAAWTLYKAIEYGVDVCIFGTIIMLVGTTEGYKKFLDWTWVLYGVMLVNVWFGCIWDPLDALNKAGIYGQAGIGELGVWLQGVFPDVSSNQIGEYAACLTALALCRLLPMSRKRVNTTWYWFVFLFGFVTVIFAQTRSALGGFCIAVFLIFLLSNRVQHGAAIVISSLFAIIVTGFGETLILYVQRGQSANMMSSFSGRLEWWQAALEKFTDYPLTGLGMWAAARFGVLAKIGFTQTATIHSDWVEIIVGMGAWGVIPALLILGTAWFILVRTTISSRYAMEDRQLAYEGMAILTVVSVRMFFMTDLSLHPPCHFFIALGAAEFLRRKYQKRLAPAPAPSPDFPNQLAPQPSA